MLKNRKSNFSKNYWDMLLIEVLNQNDHEKATRYFIPDKREKEKKKMNPSFDNNTASNYFQKPEKEKKKYHLGEPFGSLYLTQREADSVFQLLHGKTLIQAGKSLALSPRTIEFYLNNVKKKLNCRKKKEVVSLIKNSAFMKNFQKSFEN